MSIFNSLVLGGGGTPKVATVTSPSSWSSNDTMTSISFTVEGNPKEWSFVCFNTAASSTAYIGSSKTIISAYSEDGQSTVCCRLYYGSSGNACIVRGRGNISTSYSNGTFTLTATSGVFQKTTNSAGTLDYVLFYTV